MKSSTPHTTRTLKTWKKKNRGVLSMLTCYDFQTAEILNEIDLDLILVGDSLGNVVLGHQTTIPVKLSDMILFARAVKRGAPQKFVTVDLPFGSYATAEQGLESAITVFQQSSCEAIKLEGASDHHLKLIDMARANGVPVMGHIGLTPQSVHELGGFYTHGKTHPEAKRLFEKAKRLEEAGAFALVLECVQKDLAKEITENLKIPTIGIGSGESTDGQVLVINDLLGEGKKTPPSFVRPVANLYQTKKILLSEYLAKLKRAPSQDEKEPLGPPPC